MHALPDPTDPPMLPPKPKYEIDPVVARENIDKAVRNTNLTKARTADNVWWYCERLKELQ